MAEGVTVFGPEVFPWSFNWDTEKNRLIHYSKPPLEMIAEVALQIYYPKGFP